MTPVVPATTRILPPGRLLRAWGACFTAAALLAGLGDFLFFEHHIGITLALYVAAVAFCSFLLATTFHGAHNIGWASVTLVLSLIPAIETVNTLSVLIALTGLAAFVLLLHANKPLRLLDLAVSVSFLAITWPGKLLFDLFRFFRTFKPLTHLRIGRKVLTAWIIPLIFSGIFVSLFIAGNPLIDYWLGSIQLPDFPSERSILRAIFWSLLVLMCWPFLVPAMRYWRHQSPIQLTGRQTIAEEHDIFGKAASYRALVLFNIVFGLQTALDLVYLWGHGALPAGMTFAQYAHNGTYALLAAALLSAVFILVITGEARCHHKNGSIYILLLVWIAQNIFLVVSTIMRMKLYIDAYALTYLRIAALIWMLLVLLGVLYIALRLILERSNGWLIRMNVATLAIVLYATSLANLPYLISAYNVANAIRNPSVNIDVYYLLQLGRQALPAIDRAIASDKTPPYMRVRLHNIRLYSAKNLHLDDTGWRAWSYRNQRLINYLHTNSH